MKNWRLLNLEYSDSYLNMAVEEAILLAAEKGLTSNTIRLWINPRSVIIGRFQNVFHEVNLKVCNKYGITIVRRFTGGGAVYHDYGNLNWTIVLNKNHPLAPKIPAEIYKVASNAIIEGIKSLGVRVIFESPNIIQIGGKKISGLAAYVKKNTILCHGTLLVNTDLSILPEALSVDYKLGGQTLSRSWRTSAHTEVTTLQHELNKRIPISFVKELILLGFDKLYGIVPKLGKLNNFEERTTQILYYEKYVKKEWNFGSKDG